MAENAGTIYYDVDVNTQGVLEAQKKLNTANAGIEKSFDGIGSSSKKAQTGIDGFGRKAGAAGIQIQQFVGQVQGGQSAMVAMSQQAADLGIVLGAPLIGAVVGIAAALAGPFITAVMNSSQRLDEMKDAIDAVRDSVDAAKIRDLTDQIEIQEKVVADANMAFDKLTDSGVTLGKSFEDAANKVDIETETLKALRDQLEKVEKTEDFIASRKEARSKWKKKWAVDELAAASNIIKQQQQQFQDEQALADEQLAVRLEAIDLARQKERDIGQSYDQAEYEAKALHAEALAELDKKRTDEEAKQAQQRLALKQAEVNAYAMLGGQLSNLFATIGAEQTALGKAVFLANQALAVAQIIVSTQQAAAQALTLDPTGALSSRVTALGYASAGIAAGVAVGETFAGRQVGGPVQAGSAYRVNEAGTEGYKFSSAGRDYIQMLGGNGEIVPANQLEGGSVSVSVTVNNAAGIGANVQSSDDGRYITIDTFRTDMAEGGPMSRSMTGAFEGLKRRTS